MPRLIWVFAGRTLILLVLSCRGSSFNHLQYILLLRKNGFQQHAEQPKFGMVVMSSSQIDMSRRKQWQNETNSRTSKLSTNLLIIFFIHLLDLISKVNTIRKFNRILKKTCLHSICLYWCFVPLWKYVLIQARAISFCHRAGIRKWWQRDMHTLWKDA